AEDGIRDKLVTGVQTCALPIFSCVGGSFIRHDCEPLILNYTPIGPVLRPLYSESLLNIRRKSPAEILLLMRLPDERACRRRGRRSEERRVGKECRSRGWACHVR